MPKPMSEALYIDSVREAHLKRAESLTTLMSKPFDINNEAHIEQVRQYMDQYEYKAHQRKIISVVQSTLYYSAATWVLLCFLRMPEFINTFSTIAVLLGVAASAYKSKDQANLLIDDSEMRNLYKWVFNKPTDTYDPKLDRSAMLVNPDMQRLVRLIAPYSTDPDSVIVWPKTSKSSLKGVVALGMNALSSAFSVGDPPAVKQLKQDIESQSFNVGWYDSIERSVRFFVTNPYSKLTMQNHVNAAKAVLPSATEAVSMVTNK